MLITGASKGIGYGIAAHLAAEGCALTLVARDPAGLEKAAAALAARHPGLQVATVAADLGQRDQLGRVFPHLETTDILINSAGAVPRGKLLDTSAEQLREAMDGKGFGAIDLCREAYRHMQARRDGVILNIIGISGERPNPKSVPTSTVNAALIAFTEAVGAISPDDNIRVLGLNPGLVATERTAGLMKPSGSANDAAYAHLTANLPFGRMATTDEIADFAAFLVSPRASYCSGTVYTVDGGARFRA
ncbi:SDR family oxidoreductase [Belnapia sp. T6]|uniref:SDR family oxidoreductase n=1 Tax=Belnapia mucosa TaxID=2804532 RepID=A0ABS1V6I4_9PROT|nr:SDR family oxidoreductase [Belnapia mucosa]